MKQVYIGTWPLGWRNVDLYGTIGILGGSFYFLPDNKSNGRVKITLDHDKWGEVLGVLHHECGEFLMQDMGFAFKPDRSVSGDANNLMFSFRHHDWSEIAQHLADFIEDAYDPLKAAWKKASDDHRKALRK